MSDVVAYECARCGLTQSDPGPCGYCATRALVEPPEWLVAVITASYWNLVKVFRPDGSLMPMTHRELATARDMASLAWRAAVENGQLRWFTEKDGPRRYLLVEVPDGGLG